MPIALIQILGKGDRCDRAHHEAGKIRLKSNKVSSNPEIATDRSGREICLLR
ncbi:hypothetical protein PI95_009640 [Hassallia byssoidea VB512170]|uniref:Uncharacterized protein n=1 Tax=Hassallia byssoidea VB512170 TaxID=1304833 RepID=A0A846H6Z2_9CYAN|nr:hypothetical protein [Hassalia byssoidea VB512170]